MKRETHIISYFSLETDLAGEMRDWPEFVSGRAYSVDLKSRDSDETVIVRYVEDGDDRYVSVMATALEGSLIWFSAESFTPCRPTATI